MDRKIGCPAENIAKKPFAWKLDEMLRNSFTNLCDFFVNILTIFGFNAIIFNVEFIIDAAWTRRGHGLKSYAAYNECNWCKTR